MPAQLILMALDHGQVHLGAELVGQAALRGLDDGGVGDPSPRGLMVLSHDAVAFSGLFSGA